MGQYNRLTPVGDISKHRMYHKAVFLCDCGNTKEILIKAVKEGNTKSCGCLHREFLLTGRARKKHGLKSHKLYDVWSNMKQRCYYENHIQYQDWGGRGIAVCDEWLQDFKVFYDWAIQNGWRPRLTIDRINNDGNYCPENCRIVTYSVNARNRRSTRLSWEQIFEIRRKYSIGSKQVDLAKEYKVTQTFISSIVLNKVYAD